MRKIFCDWCGKETPLILSTKRSRRIPLTSDADKHRLNVVIELEDVGEEVPQDLCRACVADLVKHAAAALLVVEQDNTD